MLLQVKSSFISTSGYPFRSKYTYNGIRDRNNKGFRLQYMYKKSIKNIHITEEEFYKYFHIIEDKDGEVFKHTA